LGPAVAEALLGASAVVEDEAPMMALPSPLGEGEESLEDPCFSSLLPSRSPLQLPLLPLRNLLPEPQTSLLEALMPTKATLPMSSAVGVAGVGGASSKGVGVNGIPTLV
jgi:hypothetical protein